MSVPEPHARILPHFAISEQGLRELEIWLLDRLGQGGGLQYHKFRQYGPHNIGDWLDVLANGFFVPDMGEARVQGAGRAMLFHTDGNTGDITFWVHDEVDSPTRDIVVQITDQGLIYFLDGQDDIGYTEGGQILRYSGGGNITYYTSEDLSPTSGNFEVITSGTSDDSAATLGTIRFSVSNDAGVAGNVEAHTGGITPGYVWLDTTSTPGIPPNPGDIGAALDTAGSFRVMDSTHLVDRLVVAEDSTTTVNLDDTKTFIVNDHLGSPLVTYTG